MKLSLSVVSLNCIQLSRCKKKKKKKPPRIWILSQFLHYLIHSIRSNLLKCNELILIFFSRRQTDFRCGKNTMWLWDASNGMKPTSFMNFLIFSFFVEEFFVPSCNYVFKAAARWKGNDNVFFPGVHAFVKKINTKRFWHHHPKTQWKHKYE